jgi:spore cortex formation protein SpoVR/YcgB (stage V sporulation)
LAINIYQFQNKNKNVIVDNKINDQEIKQIKKNIIDSQDCEMNRQPQIENL